MSASGRQRLLADNSGMALLITIMVISLLIAITVQFNRIVRQNFFASATQLDGLHLRTVARSGLVIAEAILEADGKAGQFDTLQDSWAILDVESFPGLFSRGALNLKIVDYSGRLQINALVQDDAGGEQGGGENNASNNKEILKRLLLSGRFQIEDDSEAQEIIDALVDWLDPDERESDFGAESTYYRSLEIPYDCQNGPVAVIEDLLLVKGITPLLLFGDDSQPGLADYLTVYGDDGKININTAPVELLEAMHTLMSEELAVSMDEYRVEESNFESLEKVNWYKNVPAWPGDVELPENVISTTSFYFHIVSEGTFHDQRRQMTAVIGRDKDNNSSLIYRKVE